MNKYVILFAISAIFIVSLVLITILLAYNLFASYLTGSWVATDGSIVLVNYNGIFYDSVLTVGNDNNDGSYETLRRESKMLINPLSFFDFKAFTAYFAEYKLSINIVSGTLSIIRRNDKKNYGTFYRNSLGV